MSDSQRLRAIIEGDAKGAIQAFDQVTNGAEKMGKGVSSAAKQAGRSLEEMEARSKRANDAGKQLAIGAAAVGSAFVLASRNTVANEQAIRTLERGYGDAADGLRDFADEIQRTTTFSNESAIASLNTFRVLADNYGFTADQIRTLTQVSADLAASQGIDLNEAATRVAAAMRGEAESAEFLGLTLNDSALGIDHLAKSTTDAEKSQIRFNALLDQSAFAQGAAAERAATTAGQVEQLANRVQDSTQAFVQWTGPIGQAAGALGSFGLEAGLAAGGLVQLGRGLATAAPLVSGLATGPVGLGILAAGAIAAGAAFLILRDNSSDLEQGMQEAEEAAGTLREEINKLLAVGDEFGLVADALGIKMGLIGVAVDVQAGKIPALREEVDQVREGLNAWELQGAAVQAEMERNGFAYDEQKAKLAELEAQLVTAEGSVLDFADAELALSAIFANQGIGADRARANIVALFKAYEEGAFGAVGSAEAIAGLNDAIIDVANNFADYNAQALRAAGATDTLGESAVGAAGGVNQIDEAAVRATKSIGVMGTGTYELSKRLKEYTEGGERAALATEEWNRQQAETAVWAQTNSDRLRDYAEGGERAADATEDMIRRISLPPDITIPEFVAPGSMIEARSAVDGLAGSYLNLGLGIMNANDAQNIFKGTQDGLIASQGVYSHQQSEYEAQLGSLQEAEDILNQRRADGIALTAEQADFLDRVNAAQERLTGGAEDAAIAEGMLALQYAENVRIGDQLNSTMEGQQQITSALIGLVTDLIGALDGIPEDVRTDIELVGADAAINQAASLAGTLASIPLSKRIDIVTAFSQTGTPPALAGLGGGIAFQHGGVVHAQHGLATAGGARFVHMNEAGGEDVLVPGGSYIRPHPASRLARGRGGDGPAMIFNAPVYVIANDADVYSAIRQQMTGGARP